MKNFTESFLYETPSVEPATITAILTCMGAKTTSEEAAYILARQNPFRQKRGGLGFGAYSIVDVPGERRSFSNININNAQAETSPLRLVIRDTVTGEFILEDQDKTEWARGTVLSIPAWGTEKLSTEKPAITVLQQHGPVNIVGVLGSSQCELFSKKSGCTFCMMNNSENNTERSAEEIVEAFQLAKQDRKAYNLTLTTTLQTSEADTEKLLRSACEIKKGIGDSALALEVAPFKENERVLIRALKDAGVDTLMIPLDCATQEAQERYMLGKAALLQEPYWKNVRTGVDIFGSGNTTSSIIVGLEPLEATLDAIRKMLARGVIPEPVPVRWDDTKLSSNRRLPLTAPDSLLAARNTIRSFMQSAEVAGTIQKTRAGCAACGGCGGIVVNSLRSDKNALPII